jgi:hypothetical protein
MSDRWPGIRSGQLPGASGAAKGAAVSGGTLVVDEPVEDAAKVA